MSFFSKIKNFFSNRKNEEKKKLSIKKSASFITKQINSLLFNKKQLDHDMLVKLERLLIESDIQASIAIKIINSLSEQFLKKNISEKELREFIAKELEIFLTLHNEHYSFFKTFENTSKIKTVIVSGVNGSGKTTTIAKIAQLFKNHGKNIAIICGDTFRAAADKQLIEWAKKLNIDYFTAEYKADASGFIYHTINEIKKKNTYDIIVIDTSGRLHSNTNLMEELSKIERVIKKLTTIDESLMIIDGSSGQNVISQIEIFKKYINLTGIAITKLDTSAKGGSIVSIVNKFKIPVKLIGLGESENDIVEFNKTEFIYNLLDLSKYSKTIN